ncbi:MAG TPA: hypothetical protein VHF00_03405 [Acidimicrobiales bacterium]|jgi:hypothetical protein|nr:hypothetical protein [Acidimicrobiales bacterium]
MRPLLDLYLYSSHEVAVWAPLLVPLRAAGVDVRFVLEPPGRNVARGSAPDADRGWLDDKRGRLVHLLDHRTEETIREELAVLGEEPLTRRRAPAAAVTTQGSRWLRPYSGARIRSMYGVAFVTDAYGHGTINEGFDLVLAHGPYSASQIEVNVPSASVAIVGFPKWGSFRRGEVSRQDGRRRLGLPLNGPPVLAWLPTWAQSSSLADAEAVTALAADFLVVMKPHHNTARFEDARLAAVASGVTVLPSTASLVDLLVAVDVVVGDVRSGGFTEGLLADRPVIGVARPGSSGSLHPGAFEAADVCEDLSELPALARRALSDDPHADGRRRWVPELFGHTDGDDVGLAAEAITDVLARTPASARRRISSAGWTAAYRVARRVGR